MWQMIVNWWLDFLYFHRYGLKHRSRPMTREEWVEREEKALGQLKTMGLYFTEIPTGYIEVQWSTAQRGELWICPADMRYHDIEKIIDEWEAQHAFSYRRRVGLELPQVPEKFFFRSVLKPIPSRPQIMELSGSTADDVSNYNAVELIYAVLRWKMARRSDLLAEFSGCEFVCMTPTGLRLYFRYGLPIENTPQIRYWRRVAAT
ncbi:MAG: hypothetical protein PHR51_02005 [Patescibacteria group bacterium]|nr:hypothetical protein [Patescibacteria group bacterium]